MISRQLPGTKQPYVLRAGEGERHLVGDILATALARPADTGGLLDAVVLSGGKGASFPLHRHDQWHEALIVLEGVIELSVNGHSHHLHSGAYASLPPGALHGFTMRSHTTRLLAWTIGGDASGLYASLGEPYGGYVCPPDEGRSIAFDRLEAAGTHFDVTFAPHVGGLSSSISMIAPPDAAVPFILDAGEGTRLLVADQLFTFLGHRGNSHGRFIALMTAGPRGERIPMHFHEQHTETFLCVAGAMTMWAQGEEVALLPGDFLHVPAGTIHSYRLDGHDTRFMGVLAPGVFEPFFRLLGDPYEPYVFPLEPWPFRFDRVAPKLHELDLKFVEDPRAVPKRDATA